MNTTHPSRALRGLAISASVATAGASLILAAPSAYGAPGDNGDVKVHATTTPFDDQRNEPKVCRFYLAAFNFDTVQQVTWSIDPQPAAKGTGHLDGALVLADGTGHTGPLSLPNGMYKLTWNFEGESGKAKQKVFKVSCVDVPPGSGAPTVKDVFGNVVPAGGADTGVGSAADSIDPLKAGAGIALAGGAGLFLGYRLLRRGRRGRPSGG
ncbi:hypothetical protein [Streptodolium elevatio]|uniref:Uncharacterized protein n=1 Tax=Streptodolium elevatio TaxID=3157996 RepID=A0ABV3DV34_9ACTN